MYTSVYHLRCCFCKIVFHKFILYSILDKLREIRKEISLYEEIVAAKKYPDAYKDSLKKCHTYITELIFQYATDFCIK